MRVYAVRESHPSSFTPQDWDALITGLMQQRFTAIMLNDRQRSHNQLFGLNDGGEDGDSGEGGEGQGSGSGKGSGRSVVSARDGAHGGKRSPKSGTPVLPTPATKPPAGKVSPYAAGQDSKAAPKLMSRVASSRSLKNIKSIKVSPSPTNGASPMLRESSKQRVLKVRPVLPSPCSMSLSGHTQAFAAHVSLVVHSSSSRQLSKPRPSLFGPPSRLSVGRAARRGGLTTSRYAARLARGVACRAG